MVSESDFDDGTADDDEFGNQLNGTIYLCTFSGCEKIFRRKDRLSHHLSVHEGKRPYDCKHQGCDKAYTCSAGLKRHVTNCHATKKYPQLYSCTEENCDKKFKFPYSLHRHVKRVHDIDHIKCPHCPKTFKKRQQFKIHAFQHTGIKPFKCSVDGCSKEFLLPSKLKSHMKCHDGYKCKSKGCEEIFKKWTLLQKHMENHVALHRCLLCDKVFTKPAYLRSHRRTHAAERDIFACPKNDCPRFYYYEKNLKHHMKSAHDEGDGERNHECSVCGTKLKHKCSLGRHMKLHISETTKKSKTRKCQRRRSMAAHLAGYNATKEEERSILNPDKFRQTELDIPKVVLIEKSITSRS